MASAIGRGRLLPGDRLPAVREMAVGLGIAPNTVAKAYRRLEAAGLVEGRGRHGTFVRAAPSQRTLGAEAPLAEAARSYAARAGALGFGVEEALASVKRALGRRD